MPQNLHPPSLNLTPESKQIILTPLFHASALHSQLISSFLKVGTSVIMKEFKTRDSLELMAKERVNQHPAFGSELPGYHPQTHAYPENQEICSRHCCRYPDREDPVNSFASPREPLEKVAQWVDT